MRPWLQLLIRCEEALFCGRRRSAFGGVKRTGSRMLNVKRTLVLKMVPWSDRRRRIERDEAIQFVYCASRTVMIPLEVGELHKTVSTHHSECTFRVDGSRSAITYIVQLLNIVVTLYVSEKQFSLRPAVARCLPGGRNPLYSLVCALV